MINKLKIILIFLLPVFSLTCTEEFPDNPVADKSPETYLFLYPDSSISQQPSRLRVSWSGDDADGLVIGFYFKWSGLDSNWTFTTKNDSTFALPIGSTDTTYLFSVSAVDNSGNGVYDNSVFSNGIDYGPEPFTDLDSNGIYNEGEEFIDIGLIDPSPATTVFPIKNTAPEIEWTALTFLPDTSFPVMTFNWFANDIDGIETILNINIALNDTNNFVSLSGNTTLITIRTNDFDDPDPEMEILIDGSELNIHTEMLPGLKLNDTNVFYVQAEDISGAKTKFISIPDTSGEWYVQAPRGKLLIVDNYNISDPVLNAQAAAFYNNAFSSIGGGALINEFDVLDLAANPLPFENVTFPETLKLFKYIFWYSDTKPRIDLLSITTNPLLDLGTKIAFSLSFEDSTSSFAFDKTSLQNFLPVDSLVQKKPVSFIFNGTVEPVDSQSGYPVLTISSTISSVRTFFVNQITASAVYEIHSTQLNGTIGLKNNDNSLFFIGAPLHQLDGGESNVIPLLDKIFFEDFGIVP